MAGSGPGVWVSRTQAIVIIVLFALIVVGVGLMAGLIKAPCETDTSPTTGTTSGTTAGTTAATTPPGEQGPWQDPFLPLALVPVHYDLWFHPDFYWDAGTFTGRADIRLNVTSRTRYVIVHYKMMNVTSTRVTVDDVTVGVTRAFPYDVNQYWVTEVERELVPGEVLVLHLEFAGSLLNGIVGYYKSTYINGLTGLER